MSSNILQLEKDIFGEGSDLSSDDEGPRRYAQQSRGATQDRSSPDSVAEYAKAKPKKRKARVADGEEPPRKRKKKKATPPPDEPLGPEEERRRRVDQELKDILKPNKSRKRSKKNEDDLDKIADDYISGVRDEMMWAAQEDRDAHKSGLPALAKLRMLDKVLDVMQKRQYTTAIMDQNLLDACRVWLEPLDNKSLPALNIQRGLMEQFGKMDITTEILRESRLGRIVLFYSKCKRVTLPMQRMALQLLDNWSRPILRRSSSYRDKIIPTASVQDMEGISTHLPKLSAILTQAKANTDPTRVRKHMASIPERTLTTYTVAPKFSASMFSRTPHDDALAVRRSTNQMMKRIQKSQKGSKA